MDAKPSDPERRWATDEEWAAHRDRIVRMYLKEPKTLSHIIRIMEHDHQFYATARMYKTRLRRWGVHKNNKRSKPNESAPASTSTSNPLSSSSSSTSPPSASSSSSESTKISPPSSSSSPPSDDSRALQRATPPPNLDIFYHLVDSPENQSKRQSLWAMDQYVECLQDSWYSVPRRHSPPANLDWLAQTKVAAQLISRGQVQRGFTQLGDFLSLLKVGVARQSPVLPLEAYFAACNLLSASPDLWLSFLQYLLNLTSIILHPSHPIHIAIAALLSGGSENFTTHGDTILRAYLGFAKRRTQNWDHRPRHCILKYIVKTVSPPRPSNSSSRESSSSPGPPPAPKYAGYGGLAQTLLEMEVPSPPFSIDCAWVPDHEKTMHEKAMLKSGAAWIGRPV